VPYQQRSDDVPPLEALTVEEGVHEFTQLAELCDALATHLSGWSTDGADPASSGAMASLSTRLSEHAGWWRDRIPESVLLEEIRRDASGSSRLSDVLAHLDVNPPDRTAAVGPILDDLVTHLLGLAKRMSSIGDGPARRVVRLVLADLEDRPT